MTAPRDLRSSAPWAVFEGFGRAVASPARFARPGSPGELADLIQKARQEGLSVTFRGSGRSYGDASLNTGGLVLDLTGLAAVLNWDPESGVMECGPGLTIEGLWNRTIRDGYWPAVVPGTMKPTLGGCAAMNVHGKNNFGAGPFGEHVLEFDLMAPRGEVLTCSKDRNADIFHAAIAGLGLLGAFTRIRLKLKKVYSGNLRVTQHVARDLDEQFDIFESNLASSDYLVGWLDCFARGAALGRGLVHTASYLEPAEDSDPAASFEANIRGLPPKVMGVPRSQVWRLMGLGMNDPAVALVNAAKYRSARLRGGHSYFQSHVAFNFLLDYVPDWQMAYGIGGFIQYQVFAPHEKARQCMREVLRACQQEGIRPYLGVFKRHRPDGFLMSHGLDGWSLALDFPVREGGRRRLWEFTHRLTDLVLRSGGKFYLAKDAVLRPQDFESAYGTERISKFTEIKSRLDPSGVLTSDLWRRVKPA